MRLALIGPPGCGKGTQGRLLAEHYAVPHVATGELIRDAIAHRTAFGVEIEATIAAGNLLSDTTAVQVLTEHVDLLETGYILDGFPRTVGQAELLVVSPVLGPLTAAIYYDVSDADVIARLGGRWTCPKCERSYNEHSEKPLKEGLCDDDGTSLFRRPEDTPEAIATRLRLFHQQTQPLLSFFGDNGLLVRVDGSSSHELVYESTVELLREKLL